MTTSVQVRHGLAGKLFDCLVIGVCWMIGIVILPIDIDVFIQLLLNVETRNHMVTNVFSYQKFALWQLKIIKKARVFYHRCLVSQRKSKGKFDFRQSVITF
jgi:hypothetical protein